MNVMELIDFLNARNVRYTMTLETLDWQTWGGRGIPCPDTPKLNVSRFDIELTNDEAQHVLDRFQREAQQVLDDPTGGDDE